MIGLGLKPSNRNIGSGDVSSVLSPTLSPNPVATAWVTRPIEDIRVGDRVAAFNPEIVDSGDELVDPATWLKYTLEMKDEIGEPVSIQMLRSPDRFGLSEDSFPRTVYVELSDMNLAGDAHLIRVEPCPPLKSGPGRLVITTVTRRSTNVLDLTISGLNEPMGVTANHPIWSEDRGMFVRVDELVIGERLLALDGSQRQLAARSLQARSASVFNLEVEGEHVYHVTESGLLVHNTCRGLHHYVMMALGSRVPRGDKILANNFLNKRDHSRLHKALGKYLDKYKRDGITMNPNRWGGELVRQTWKPEERIRALRSFYKQYQNGVHLKKFEAELKATRKAGLWN